MTTKQMEMEQWRERLEECLGEWVAITATRDHAPPALFEQTSFWGRVGGVRDEHVSIVNTDLTTDRIHLADMTSSCSHPLTGPCSSTPVLPKLR